MKRLIFHHSDLDGMGVKIVAIDDAQRNNRECETFKCNYHDVNEIVRNRLKEDMTDVVDIIIGDISVDPETAKLLDQLHQSGQVTLLLRDHHATAEHLNIYSWAEVREQDYDGVPRCGTWWMAAAFPETFQMMKTFVETVDDWDTWKWTKNDNITAKELNSLFQVIGEDKFCEYVSKVYSNIVVSEPAQLFTGWASSIIEAHDMFVNKTANSCEKDMLTMNLKLPMKSSVYKTGIIFANHDLSDIANVILGRHPELDILMIMSFPKSISYRCRKPLDIPLGDLANMMTGKGGGHPQSAGSVISSRVFGKCLEKMMKAFCGNLSGLEFHNLRPYKE